MSDKRKPDISLHAGRCSLAAWIEEKKADNGRKYKSYTLKLGIWDGNDKESSIYLYPKEVPELRRLLEKFESEFMVRMG